MLLLHLRRGMTGAGALLLLSSFAANRLGAQPKSFPQPPPARDANITAIPGVIAAGAKWIQVWQGNETADGLTASPDEGLLFAQEQTNRIMKIDKNDKASVFLSNPHGAGSVAVGPKGVIYGLERSCTDPGGHFGQTPDTCKEATGISVLTPDRKVLADNIGGKPLGRVNDMVVDKNGGVYFTSGGAFYMNPKGQVMSIGENLRTNGIILSADEKTLYITNGPVIAAFDVQPDGSVKNQREFGKLEGGGNGDGMAIDSEGRLYVTTPPGVQVLSREGKYLGLIPTHRNSISLAFSGPGKKTLYVACTGALGPDGKEVATPPGVRNTAMTVYKVATLATGFKGRVK
jgi:gluconolactonase